MTDLSSTSASFEDVIRRKDSELAILRTDLKRFQDDRKRFVAYQLPQLFPTIVAFQYNPEHLTRSVQGRAARGGGRGDANRTDGPPDETITLTVEIDAHSSVGTSSGDKGKLALALGIR